MKAMLVGVLAAGAVAIAGCGSEEASVLKTAFNHPIKSGNVSINVDVGSQAQVAISGPFQSNGENKLPSLDWQIHVAGGPTTIDGEIISSGDNAFVKYGGQTYEVGKDVIAKLQSQAQGQNSFKAADISQLTRKMRSWFPQSSTQEDAKLDGEDVTRVTGRLDLSKAVKDISAMAQNGPAVTQKDIQKLDKQVTDPRFTVDVAKSDGTLRRVLATLRVNGQGGLRFEVRYRDVNKPVTIDAPSSGLPLAQLEQKLEHDFGGSDTSSGSGSSSS